MLEQVADEVGAGGAGAEHDPQLVALTDQVRKLHLGQQSDPRAGELLTGLAGNVRPGHGRLVGP